MTKLWERHASGDYIVLPVGLKCGKLNFNTEPALEIATRFPKLPKLIEEVLLTQNVSAFVVNQYRIVVLNPFDVDGSFLQLQELWKNREETLIFPSGNSFKSILGNARNHFAVNLLP